MTLAGTAGQQASLLPPPDAERDRTALPPGLLCLGLAVVTAVPVVQDRLQLLAVVCALALPFVLRRAVRDRRVLLLVITAGVWGVGQLVADQVNGLGPRMSLPLALAGIVFCTAPTLVVLAREDFRRVRILVLGVAAGLVLGLLLVDRLPLGDPESWKFGLNTPVTVALLATTDLAWRRGHRVPSILALAAVLGIGLWSDHRGLAGVAVLTALFVLVPRRRPHRNPGVSAVAAGTALLLGALSVLFVDSAQSGLLGERSVNQVHRYGANPFSILVNVRPELFQELSLFLQRPLTGFGSAPRLDAATYDRSLEFLRAVGVTRTDLRDYWLHVDDPGVSAHSMAADSWARAGISAVPFWVLVVVLALWAGTTAIQRRSSPLLVLWTMLVLWDTFFSPLTGLAAITLAAYLALAVVTIAANSGRVPVPDGTTARTPGPVTGPVEQGRPGA